MRRHAADGASIVSHLANPWVVHGVRSHHERMDGKGYPDGLADAEIPLAPRIIAVADTYDAMTTSRPYRAGLPPRARGRRDRRRRRQPVLPAGGGRLPKPVRERAVPAGRGTRNNGRKDGRDWQTHCP